MSVYVLNRSCKFVFVSVSNIQVPRQRIRAESPNPESHGTNEQNLDIVEGNSDNES